MNRNKYVDPGTIYDDTYPELAELVQKQRKALGALTEYNFHLFNLDRDPNLREKTHYKKLEDRYREVTLELDKKHKEVFNK